MAAPVMFVQAFGIFFRHSNCVYCVQPVIASLAKKVRICPSSPLVILRRSLSDPIFDITLKSIALRMGE